MNAAAQPTTVTASKKNKKSKKDRKRKHCEELDVSLDTKHSRPSKEFGTSTIPIVTNTDDVLNQEARADVSVAYKKKRKKKKKKDRRVKSSHAGDSSVVDSNEDTTKTVSPVTTNDSNISTEDSKDVPVFSFPFPTDPDDHCESPLQAYAHIQPLLSQIANDKQGKDVKIYDPYFCNGAVIENLNALGFPCVYNKKEDCYGVWKSSTGYPEYDCFVTNPPYSMDHIEKLVEHITGPRMKGRPWFLLMPEWVHKKDYFLNKTKSQQMEPFYLVPKKRYVYLPPKDYRVSKKSDTHKKSSPFNSMWYIWGGTKEKNEKLVQFCHSKVCTFSVVTMAKDSTEIQMEPRVPLSQACEIARSKSALRDLRRKRKK